MDNHQSVDVEAKNVPVLVRGEVVQYPSLNAGDVVVAILINGIVQAVTKPYFDVDGMLLFSKILPEEAFLARNDLLAVLLVADSVPVEGAQNDSF
jgi:hypothetical protein